MTHKLLAFVDEFGNNSFDFESQGSHFIIAAVIVKEENVDSVRNEIIQLKSKHKFQTGEIKSSGVGINYERRKRILRDISKLNISIFAVVVDKKSLFGVGFGYKKSFYKYLNSLLYKELYRTFPKLNLFVDEHGGKEFIIEFKRYVETNHIRTLFSGSEFNVLNSKQSEFIQIADFIAGTLGYVFDENKKSNHSEEFQSILTPLISSINFFPNNFSFQEFKDSNIDERFDVRIAETCFMRVQNFLNTEKSTHQQAIDQINFLKTLVWLQRGNPINKYISTPEILGHLNQGRKEKIQEEYFRAKVVGSLRDKGILIASSRQGYKIPTSSKDLDSFIKHGNRIILPMLNRINEARNAIKLATMNEYDLLTGEEYSKLRVFFGD